MQTLEMKDSLNINEILSASKGRLVRGEKSLSISGVSIDTRTIKKGEIFVALKGDTFDGHDFVLQAIEKGACGAVIDGSQSDRIEKNIKDATKALIAVDDTITSLQEMAAFHRQKYYIRVVGVTGTNGKTTTKEMIARILSQRLRVLKNEGNLNNHIGVPITLLRLNKKHQTAVIEMGMSGLGEIKRLCEIAAPNIGVVTNIGHAHLEGLGSLENVIKAKGEIIESLSESDTAVINADDKNSAGLKNKAKGKVITFGIDNDADIRAVDVRHLIPAGMAFAIINGREKIDVSLPLSGRHNIYNALAAASASVMLNFDLADIKAGLEGFEPFKMRSEILALNSGVRIINDSYNANPASMEAAIRLLSDFKNNGMTFAALGGMFELGDYAEEAHLYIGRVAVDSGIDYLIVIGELARFIASGASSAGMKQDNIFVCRDHEEAVQILNKLTKSGDTVLIKGSRKMAMERIAEGLMRGDKKT